MRCHFNPIRTLDACVAKPTPMSPCFGVQQEDNEVPTDGVEVGNILMIAGYAVSDSDGCWC